MRRSSRCGAIGEAGGRIGAIEQRLADERASLRRLLARVAETLEPEPAP